MSNLAASLPPPTPLRQALSIHYQWGEQKFDIVATAASIRTVEWEDTGEDVTWLHCKAIQTMNIKPDGSSSMMNVLIPAHYVTHAEPGPTFYVSKHRPRPDLGIFPPTQPAPANPVPLAELDRLIGTLVDPTLN
jgi:hypothetical protein